VYVCVCSYREVRAAPRHSDHTSVGDVVAISQQQLTQVGARFSYSLQCTVCDATTAPQQQHLDRGAAQLLDPASSRRHRQLMK